MKKLFMKQKVFSLRDRFTVLDEWGDDRYSVAGELISLGRKLHIYDLQGDEVAFIQQKVLSLRPRYFVYVGEEQVAEIVKEFTFFRPKYSIYGPDWTCQGEVLDHDYEILDGDRPVARIHRAWLSWGDSYEIDIDDHVDEVQALAVVLAIDCVLDSQAAAAASSSST